MDSKINQIIETMPENELYKLRAEISNGAINLKKQLDKKIKLLENSKTGYCITCGKDVSSHPTSFTLIFGENEFRKKAIFCEIDCLQYFLSEIKQIKNNYQAKGDFNGI
ncbi:MAG: hypothetical protein ACOC3X_01200 [Nanoarchaeota archaeon]